MYLDALGTVVALIPFLHDIVTLTKLVVFWTSPLATVPKESVFKGRIEYRGLRVSVEHRTRTFSMLSKSKSRRRRR